MNLNPSQGKEDTAEYILGMKCIGADNQTCGVFILFTQLNQPVIRLKKNGLHPITRWAKRRSEPFMRQRLRQFIIKSGGIMPHCVFPFHQTIEFGKVYRAAHAVP